jgi:hypothetical protein
VANLAVLALVAVLFTDGCGRLAGPARGVAAAGRALGWALPLKHLGAVRRHVVRAQGLASVVYGLLVLSLAIPAADQIFHLGGLAAALGVEIAFEKSHQSVEGRVGAVALGGEDDLVAVLDPEGHDAQDAGGVDGLAVALADAHLGRLLAGGLDEHRGRARMQPDGAGDDRGALGHGASSADSFTGGSSRGYSVGRRTRRTFRVRCAGY